MGRVSHVATAVVSEDRVTDVATEDRATHVATAVVSEDRVTDVATEDRATHVAIAVVSGQSYRCGHREQSYTCGHSCSLRGQLHMWPQL